MHAVKIDIIQYQCREQYSQLSRNKKSKFLNDLRDTLTDLSRQSIRNGFLRRYNVAALNRLTAYQRGLYDSAILGIPGSVEHFIQCVTRGHRPQRNWKIGIPEGKAYNPLRGKIVGNGHKKATYLRPHKTPAISYRAEPDHLLNAVKVAMDRNPIPGTEGKAPRMAPDSIRENSTAIARAMKQAQWKQIRQGVESLEKSHPLEYTDEEQFKAYLLRQ